jgi:pyruvate,water dikinase
MVKNGIQEKLHPAYQNCYTIFQNHVMLNLSQTMYKDPAVISDRYVSEICVLGHPVENDHLEGVLQAFLSEYPRWKRVLNFARVMRMMYTAYGDGEFLDKQYHNFAFPSYFCRPCDIYGSVEACFKAYLEVWRCHVARSGYSGLWYHLLMAILTKGREGITAENYADIALLYSDCGDVVSADVPSALQKLAKDVADVIDVKTFCGFSTDEAYQWLTNSADRGEAGRSFEDFIDKHGHRCINEIDIFEKSWSEEPKTLIPVLQNIVKSISQQTAKKEVLNAEQAVAQLKTKLGLIQRKLLVWAVPKARRAVGYREQSKSLSIKVGHALRVGYRQLANVLYQQGKLPETDLLYFLTHYEIGEFLKKGNVMKLLARAQRRRRVHPALAKTKLPDIVVGYPKLETTQEVFNGTYLEGTPVSGGVIKARVRVAVTLDQAQHIERGEILVTHSTDIAWSVYFPLLSGVITELGGLLSHGAVVAREYGLPCLVSVKEATSFFKTGDMAALDATAGRITKLESSD